MYSHYTYRKAYFDVREDGGQSEEDRIQAMIKRSDARNQHLQAQIKSYEKSIQDSEKETEEIRRMIENGTENSLYGKSLHNIHDYRDVNEPE